MSSVALLTGSKTDSKTKKKQDDRVTNAADSSMKPTAVNT